MTILPRKRIALLADVHGNLPALEAVLDRLQTQNVQELWYLGDFLGYIPFPNEVVARLRQARAHCIIGNYDRKVLAYPRKKKRWQKTKQPNKLAAFRWNSNHLQETTRTFLQGLPQTKRLRRANVTALLTHGSPASLKEVLDSETPLARLRELAIEARAQVVLCGHSHDAFKRRVGDTWFVNPGSVGRPGGGDPRAAYALLTLSADRITTQLCRVGYDLERTGRAIHAAGLSPTFYRALQHGCVEIETERES